MYVSALALDNYRSYHTLVVEFSPGVTVFHGRNGRGKTNIVEALGYLSTLSSHRVSSEKALVRRGQSAAVIRARVNDGRENLLEVELVSGGANRARINRAMVAPREIVGYLRTVTFAPEDVQIIRGDPSGRRRFLDTALMQVKPAYSSMKRDLDKVLAQRAAALKNASFLGSDTLDVWDESLVELSAQVAAHRISFVESMAPILGQAYGHVADDTKTATMEFRSKLGEIPDTVPHIEDGHMPDLTDMVDSMRHLYRHSIENNRDEEIRRRQNLVGAHLDDFGVYVDGLPAKGFASHGETWSSVLALRLAQAQVLSTEDAPPILILDDVFAELDSRRRLALASRMADFDQVFVTAAVEEDLPHLMEGDRVEITWSAEKGSQIGK